MSDSKTIKLLVLFFLIVFSVGFAMWNDDNNVFEGMISYTVDVCNNEIDSIQVEASFNNVYSDASNVSLTVNNTTVVVPTTFYGMDGTVCTYNDKTLTITSSNGTTTVYTTTGTNTDITQNTFYGPNGGFCKIFTDGTSYFVEVQPANGSMYFLTSKAPYSGITSAPPYTTDPYAMFTAPYPDAAAASMFMLKSSMVPPVCPRCPDVNPALVADVAMYKNNNNNNNSSSSNSNNSNNSNSSNSSNSSNDTSTSSTSSNNSSTNDSSTSSNSSTNDSSTSSNNSSNDNSSYNSYSNSSSNSYPEESWYNNDSTKYNGKCRPCKPCGRCPEPNFECKKVPNYDIININDPGLLPITGAGTGYSTFGM
jgi:hypothetical protein